VEKLESVMNTLYEDVLPFYRELHAYVRFRLGKFYGHSIVAKNGPIPVHLLGKCQYTTRFMKVKKSILMK
jgi:peptidyl-dipeptidase A